MTSETTDEETPSGASGTGGAGGWAVLRKTAGAELCAEGRVEGLGGRDLRLERWWVRAAGEELLRTSLYEPDGRRSSKPLYLSEAELIGMLDAGWQADVFSDFFKRQLFALVARRFEG